MSDSEQYRKTLNYLARLRPLLHEYTGQLIQNVRPEGDDVNVAVSSFMHVFVEMAYNVAAAGGLSAGDFTKAMRIILEGVERDYGRKETGAVQRGPSGAPESRNLDVRTLWRKA